MTGDFFWPVLRRTYGEQMIEEATTKFFDDVAKIDAIIAEVEEN